MIYFKDPDHGYIVGDSGQVLLYDGNNSTQGNGRKTENNKGSRISNFEVFQNYPNPFNPTTLIKYSLPFSSNVKIDVYNTLGEKVKELLNEQRNAGSYSVSFNSRGLASGVYFYKIVAASLDGKHEFRDVKKMVVVK